MRASRPDIAIVSAGHDVADARLHKVAAALVRKGLTVEVFGLGDPGGGPRDTTITTTRRGSFARRAARALTLPWHSRATVLMTLDPDLVPMARLACALRRRKLVVDVHEDYSRLLTDRSWARGLLGAGARILVRLSTRLAAGADVTSVADNHIPPTSARRRIVVENLPDTALLTIGESRDPEPRAIYVGDLRTSRGLFDMIDAVARAPGWSLDLVGPVAAADGERLQARLGEPDVSGRVRLHGRLPPDRAWKIAAGAWVGLVFLHATPAFREAMPTKLYEYLAGGLPALTTRLPRQAALIEESGAGKVIDTADQAAEVLRAWAASPAELRPFTEAACTWAQGQRDVKSPYDQLAEEVAALVE